MRKKLLNFVLIFIISFMFSPKAFAEYGYAPIDIQANLFIKLFLFNNDLNNGHDIVVHVIKSPEFAAEIKKFLGKKIGRSKIIAINESKTLPFEKPSVIYLGDSQMLENVIKYTQKQNVLSITGIPELVQKGITLGIGVLDKKPKILFNVSSSEHENMDWNPIILKISTIVKSANIEQ